MKRTTRFNHPRSCPKGHRQISWHLEESEVFCWLCNRGYSMSECFPVGDAGSIPTKTEPAPANLPAGAAG